MAGPHTRTIVRLMKTAAACEAEGTEAAFSRCDQAVEQALNSGMDFEDVETIVSTMSKIVKKYRSA